MKSFRMPLRVVFYKEDERWIAHCLEFDLLGDGETRETAIESLSGAIVTQLEASIAFGNMENLFSPADGQYFQMFAIGKNVGIGEIRIQVDSMLIDSVEAREFVEDDAASKELASV